MLKKAKTINYKQPISYSMVAPIILWVDDEIESLQSQKLFLEHKGYQVQTFTNGFDAIEFVKVHPVDVVLHTQWHQTH